MTEADDERLLADLSRGDEQAFAAVYDRFGAALFRVARALLGSHQAAEDCVQMHGGYGFVKDYPAEKYFRDVKLLTIGEGTSEVQRLVIARQLLAA